MHDTPWKECLSWLPPACSQLQRVWMAVASSVSKMQPLATAIWESGEVNLNKQDLSFFATGSVFMSVEAFTPLNTLAVIPVTKLSVCFSRFNGFSNEFKLFSEIQAFFECWTKVTTHLKYTFFYEVKASRGHQWRAVGIQTTSCYSIICVMRPLHPNKLINLLCFLFCGGVKYKQGESEFQSYDPCSLYRIYTK